NRLRVRIGERADVELHVHLGLHARPRLEAAKRIERPNRDAVDEQVRLLRFQYPKKLLQRRRSREELDVDADLLEASVLSRRRVLARRDPSAVTLDRR